MMRVLKLLSPTSSLLFVLHLSALCQALTLDCHADVNITKVGPVTTIIPPRDEEEQPKTITLFLHADQSFKGVSIEAEYVKSDIQDDPGERNYTWIPKKEMCLHSGAWYEFRVRVWVKKYYYVTRYVETVPVRVDYSKCISVCERSGFWDIDSLQLIAHGSSRWKFERPNDTCGTTNGLFKDVHWNPPFPTCNYHPRQPDTPLNTTIPPVTPTTLAASAAETDTTPTIPMFTVMLAVVVLSATVP